MARFWEGTFQNRQRRYGGQNYKCIKHVDSYCLFCDGNVAVMGKYRMSWCLEGMENNVTVQFVFLSSCALHVVFSLLLSYQFGCKWQELFISVFWLFWYLRMNSFILAINYICVELNSSAEKIIIPTVFVEKNQRLWVSCGV